MEKEKESLDFSLTYGKDSYSVSGIGTCTDSDVVIPASYNGLPVTSIVPLAFHGCSSLTSITIPSSVTSIRLGAFRGCSSLTSIVVDSSNSVYDSRNNCNAIIETSTNTLIAGCKNTIIPSSVTSIGYSAFQKCSSLTSITIPSSVTSIGEWAFDSCSGLTSIVVDSNNRVYDSRNNCNAIIETSTNTLISGCKNTIIPSSVTSIGDDAFAGCSFTSITIPSSVKSIAKSAFHGCSSLTSIVVDPNNRVYDSRNNCNAIIETSTNTLISGCENTIIPSSVTSIGVGAFAGRSSLTSITIPSCVTSIGKNAFHGCESLTSIVVDSNNRVYDSRNNCNAIIETSTNTLISGCKNTIIPSSVTSIGECAFHSCSSLTSITIPSSVTSIGDDAFSKCDNLTRITIEDGITSIGDGVFDRCKSLTSITIPSSVKIIENNAFIDCSSLTSITIPSSVTSIGIGAFGGCSSLTSITIPSSVTSIGDFAFSVCSSLTSITIPSSVTSIGDYTFNKCSSLTGITIPSSVTSIGNSAFNKCSSLTSINYAGTMEQWNNIYSTDLEIRSGVVVTCADGTITINEFGLDMASCGGENDSSSSTNVTTPSTSTNVATPSTSTNVATPNDSVGLEFELSDDKDSYSVSGIGTCTDTDVVIPASYNGLPVTSIGDYAFVLCSSLTRITLPSSVKSIGDYAFYNCKSLTSITIPSSVTSIGNGAFLGSSGLTSIHYAGTMEQWKNSYGTNLKIRSGVVVTCTDGTITIE